LATAPLVAPAKQRVRRTKLLPPRLGSWIVSRPRLTAKLNQGAALPLTIVCGPAGSGKTSLLGDWATSRSVPTAWLSLDESDDNLTTFVAGLLAAVQAVVPSVGTTTRSVLMAMPHPSPEEVAIELGDELLGLDEDLVLVLDDYHLVGSLEVHDFVAALLLHPPPRFHLVISSRVEPPLALARHRVHGHVIEVRAADLTFSAEETLAFVRRATDGEVEPGTIDLLHARNEGWIAGIHLAALALRDRPDHPRTQADGTIEPARRAMDFLVDEVIDRQPEEVQRFLIGVAAPERLCAELCQALLDPPTSAAACQAMLERIEAAGIFLVRLGEEGRWFRFHHLFRDALLDRLVAREGADAVRTTHRRAGAWFADQGMIDLAIRHALAAGDAAGAADLVERHVQLALVQERWPDLERWLDLLPREQIDGRPALQIARGWVYQGRGQFGELGATLSRVAAVLERRRDTIGADDLAVLRAELDVLRLFTIVVDAHVDETLAMASRAMATLPADRCAAGYASFFAGVILQLAGDEAGGRRLLEDTLARHAGETDPLAVYHACRAGSGLVFLHLHAGDLAACRQAARDLLALADRHGLGRSAAEALAHLGEVSYERGDVDAAIAHFSAAARQEEAGPVIVIQTALGLALAYQAAGRDVEAEATLTHLLDVILAADAVEFLPPIRSFQARLAILRGDVDPALRWLRDTSQDPVEWGLHSIEVPALTRIKVMLADGATASLAAADQEIERFLRRTESTGATRFRIEALAIQALVRRARGQTGEALAGLRRSLALAEPRGFVRTFVDLGDPLARLLRELAAHDGAFLYGDRLLAAGADRASRPAPAPSEPALLSLVPPSPPDSPTIEALTEREQEILAGLQRRLSNKEIAQELAISPLTVKRHTSNIYGKLGVNSRRQAIRRIGASSPAPG
jgi:LuxR family maltose regulon positive regulatory protein